jgi:hypothetical protein
MNKKADQFCEYWQLFVFCIFLTERIEFIAIVNKIGSKILLEENINK